jgi:8-amino-7-oxononanoate synthase
VSTRSTGRGDGEAVPDFTSALYLGFRHPSSSLEPWHELTSGIPVALREPAQANQIAETLARLAGAERATLANSTLHLFWDLFVLLARPGTSIHVDEHAYPIARWGVERAAARGIAAHSFRHRDPDALRRQLRLAKDRRPLVVADGYCPGCGPVPLRAYLDLARRYGGLLIIDDTQALGVLGSRPAPGAPLGRGGGGSLRRQALAGPGIVLAASLAKGFGAPLAVLMGDTALVREYELRAATRVHCSPPSTALLHAAAHALALNSRLGDALRARLAALIARFRAGVAAAGLRAHGGLFPVQTIATGAEARSVHERLSLHGVQAVLHDGDGRSPRLSFLLTALHDERTIDAGVTALETAVLARRLAG